MSRSIVLIGCTHGNTHQIRFQQNKRSAGSSLCCCGTAPRSTIADASFKRNLAQFPLHRLRVKFKPLLTKTICCLRSFLSEADNTDDRGCANGQCFFNLSSYRNAEKVVAPPCVPVLLASRLQRLLPQKVTLTADPYLLQRYYPTCCIVSVTSRIVQCQEDKVGTPTTLERPNDVIKSRNV